jgi:hypothetical protein
MLNARTNSRNEGYGMVAPAAHVEQGVTSRYLSSRQVRECQLRCRPDGEHERATALERRAPHERLTQN